MVPSQKRIDLARIVSKIVSYGFSNRPRVVLCLQSSPPMRTSAYILAETSLASNLTGYPKVIHISIDIPTWGRLK